MMTRLTSVEAYPWVMPGANHLLESELSRSIIGAFYTVYNYFG